MNFIHKETLSENDWKMIRDGKGFVLTDEEAEEMALDILGQTGYIRERSDEEVEQMALDILEKAGYDLDTLKKKKIISNCPICSSKVNLCVQTLENKWSDKAEIFFVNCYRCGIRSAEFWTEREALEGWEKLCEKAKVQI